MSQKLCRLQTIHAALLPWQRATFRHISNDIVLMVNSADDAIRFVTRYRATSREPPVKRPSLPEYTGRIAN